MHDEQLLRGHEANERSDRRSWWCQAAIVSLLFAVAVSTNLDSLHGSIVAHALHGGALGSLLMTAQRLGAIRDRRLTRRLQMSFLRERLNKQPRRYRW